MGKRVVRVVRWLDGPRWTSPLPIWAGDPPEPIRPDWAAITAFEESSNSPGVFVLEFLTEDGQTLEHLPFETLEIALDQAKDIAGIDARDWRQSDIVVPDGLEYLSKTIVAG